MTNNSLKTLALALLISGLSVQAGAVEIGETRSFTLTSVSDVTFTYSWNDLRYRVGNVVVEDNGQLTYTLDSNTSYLMSNGSTGTDFPLSFSSLAIGDHTLTITGVWRNAYNLPVARDAYLSLSTPTITAVAAPVPEPESYAMLLAGLGVMGVVARRRKKARTV